MQKLFRPPLSIGQLLTLIVLITAFPLIALAFVLQTQLGQSQREHSREALLSTARSLAALVDNEVDNYLAVCGSIGAFKNLELDNRDVFTQQVQQVLGQIPGTWISVFSPQGRLLQSTLIDTRLPQPERGARDVMEKAWETGTPQLSNVVLGRLTGRYNAFVECPILRNAERWFSVVLGLDPDRFKVLIGNKMSPDSTIGILDRNLNFVARQPDHELRVGKPASSAWRRAIAASPEGTSEITTLEGDLFLTAYTPTRDGWTVGVGRSVALLNEAALQTQKKMAFIGGFLLALSLLLGLGLAGMVRRSLTQLAFAAKAIGQNEPIQETQSPILETQAISKALVAASDELRTRQAALREGQRRLEMALDAGKAGIWESWPDEGVFIASDRALAHHRLPSGTVMTHELALAAVHPEDRKRVEAAVHATLTEGIPFAIEFRTLGPDGSSKWLLSQAELRRDGGKRRLIGLVRDVTERRRAQEQQQFLADEVAHRSKNILSLVRAIARQSLAGDPVEFVNSFDKRIMSLAASHDLLIGNAWQSVSLHELLTSQLGHFDTLISRRIVLDGPPLKIKASAAQSLGMAFHELSTNAAKYGALSNDLGKVDIEWDLAQHNGNTFTIAWSETGGPPLVEPSRRGFGHTVLGRLVKVSLGATVTLEYQRSGARWRASCPGENVIA